MKVLFLGTGSGAGKTTVTAMYCRYLHNKGESVAPFKASNLSLSSFDTPNGPIGIGQAFQALACGVEPTTDMNPVLLRPEGKGVVEVVFRGQHHSMITPETPIDHVKLRKDAGECFDRLSESYDHIICEGSGSPAEINLQERDLANVGMMRSRNVPAILVGDIERGGVFAAIYGTWRLIPEDVKPLMKGFIINRFRGDASLLKAGTDRIEELTGMKYLGVMPYKKLRFPAEDSLSDPQGHSNGSDENQEFLSNLDKLLEESLAMGLDIESMEEISRCE